MYMYMRFSVYIVKLDNAKNELFSTTTINCVCEKQENSQLSQLQQQEFRFTHIHVYDFGLDY